MEHDIHDRTARRLVLQRHRRLIRRRSVHWDYVRGKTLLLPRTSQLTSSATCSFTIGSDGSLVVTVGPRQAIAVHVGQLGTGTGLPPTAQQIPVLFYEIANTTMGEVGSPSFLSSVRLSGYSSCWKSNNRTFSSWEACLN